MSQFTNFGENQLVDKLRGVEPSYPASNWFVAFASAADDASFVELTGPDLARVAVARSLAKWQATQGGALASTGTTHVTSNTDAIEFGTATDDLGTANFVVICDALSGGNAWFYAPLPTPFAINSGDAPSLDAGALQFSLGLTGGMTDLFANKWIDEIWRGQAYAIPGLFGCLFTAAPTNAGGGTEVSGGSYARPEIEMSFDALSGTQGAGSTAASSGTGGRISNNDPLTYPAPTADWGVVLNHGVKDAATLGNLLLQKAITPKTISAGGAAPNFAPNTFGISIR